MLNNSSGWKSDPPRDVPTRTLECDLIWNESHRRSKQGEELDVRPPGPGWALNPKTSRPPGGGREKRRQAREDQRDQHRRGCGHSQEPRSHQKRETSGVHHAPAIWTRPPHQAHSRQTRSAVTHRFLVVKSWPAQDVRLCRGPASPAGTSAPGSLAAGHAPGGNRHFFVGTPPLPSRTEVRMGRGRAGCLPASPGMAGALLWSPDTWSPGMQPARVSSLSLPPRGPELAQNTVLPGLLVV